MSMIGGPFRVFVGLAPMGYLNPKQLEQTIREGMLFCGTPSVLEKLPRPSQVVLKPNVIFAHSKLSRYSYTHPEIVRATLGAFFSFLPGAQVKVVEKSYNGTSTRSIFKKANGFSESFKTNGYYELERMFPGQVLMAPIEEAPLSRYQLSKGESIGDSPSAHTRIRNEIVTSRHFENTHFTICTPKLQTGLYSNGFSGALATAGSLETAYEIQGNHHDYTLCDALEIGFPRLIVSDGIIVPAGGSYLTQRGHELGVILISNNPVAHDWVAAQLFNLDPAKIPLIKLAIERGWGPVNSNIIEIGGAGREGLQLLSQKTQYWDLGAQSEAEFEAKFEKENSVFPFEIMKPSQENAANKHGAVLLDWFYQVYDQTHLRGLFAKAPALSVATGKTLAYPQHKRVILMGDAAIHSFQFLVSSSRIFFKTRSFAIEKAQLKNGRKHWLFKLSDRKHPMRFSNHSSGLIPPSSFALSAAFSLATLGRVGLPLFWIYLFQKKARILTRKRYLSLPLVLTSRFTHNLWWALPLQKNKKKSPFTETMLNAP
jgi:uncharacterized protein (DUF362 family)